MKINKGDVILDIPSKSIEDDTIDTIRYKEARDKKPSKLKAYRHRDRYFRMIRQAIRYDLFMTLKVYGTGNMLVTIDIQLASKRKEKIICQDLH